MNKRITSLVIFLILFLFFFLISSNVSSISNESDNNSLLNETLQSILDENLSETSNINESSYNENKEIEKEFLNKTINYEYGKFKPKIREIKERNEYFKKLNLKDDEVYVLLEFKDEKN